MSETIVLTDDLTAEYQKLWSTCLALPQHFREVVDIAERIRKNQALYTQVSTKLSPNGRIPWQIIGVIHSMECQLSMYRHLHNGDPLTKRTEHVPVGRPIQGNPPFTWEDSAVDALNLRKIQDNEDWTPEGMLFFLEGYNGFGYRKYRPEVLSPYLWSYSKHYFRGKYTADGKWDPTLVSKQCGAVVLLRSLYGFRL